MLITCLKHHPLLSLSQEAASQCIPDERYYESQQARQLIHINGTSSDNADLLAIHATISASLVNLLERGETGMRKAKLEQVMEELEHVVVMLLQRSGWADRNLQLEEIEDEGCGRHPLNVQLMYEAVRMAAVYVVSRGRKGEANGEPREVPSLRDFFAVPCLSRCGFYLIFNKHDS